MKPPHGLDEIVAAFGDPRKFYLPDGTLSPAWERTYITRIDLPAPLVLDLLETDDEPSVSRVACHINLANLAEELFERIWELGLWEKLPGLSGSYLARPQRRSRKLSLHTWGVAFDFGASRDPQGDPHIDMPIEIVNVFESYGFSWGGRWHNLDAMHFQYATGY